MKKTILLFVALLLLMSCAQRELTYYESAPAGTLEIGNNFYADQTEITNFSWLEYMFYTEQVYGKKSFEYQACLPDTLVWLRDVPLSWGMTASYTDYYLRHPAYRNFPVVGITYEQACAYSKWRSDRVMEYILVNKGVIRFHAAHTPDSMFTIQKYFAGGYLGFSPSPETEYYPEYSLPDKNQWKKINHVSDSLNVRWTKKYHRKIDGDREKYRQFFNWKCDTIAGVGEVTVPVTMRKSDKRTVLWHVKGNVRELGAEKGISYGGSWKDNIKTVLATEQFPTHEPNAWTGFRNVCAWKKWE